jgi:oxygen-independent coproporphyrinogen-3 oxidase
VLAGAGYEHYELSSWALPGRESRHNGAYWDRSAYTGIGAGAHSYDGAATRSWNERDLDRYLDATEGGRRALGGEETLDAPTREFEALALGLRRVAGLSRSAFAGEFGEESLRRHAHGLAQGRDRGLLGIDGDRIRLTPAGRLLASEALEPLLPLPAA